MMTTSEVSSSSGAVANSDFLRELLQAAPNGSAVWVNAFIGNPNGSDASWQGKPYNAATMAQEVDSWSRQNTYFSVAAMRRDSDGELHRRKSHFARLLALVADDVEPADLQGTPSWGIETSPNKRQIGILLDRSDPDCSNLDLVTRVVTAMAERGLIKADRSGNNAVRYVRLPTGQNQKPRDSGAWQVQVEYWNPANRYSLEDAVGIFGLDLDELRQQAAEHRPTSTMVEGEQDERLRVLTGNILRGEALHDSINVMAASLVASGAKGGAVVNILRAMMEASSAARDDRWAQRYQDIPRSVATAEQKFRLPPTPVAQVVDPDTGELVDQPIFTPVWQLLSDIKQIKWVIEGYLEQDALAMVFGPSGVGKSFVVVDWACCVATGTPWHGNAVEKGAVFYIAGEGHNGLTRRFAGWSKARGKAITKDTPLFKSNHAILLLNQAEADKLAAEIERMAAATGQAPRLIMVDTLARNFGPGDENKQEDANAFIAAVDRLRRQWNCTIVIVHHSGHDMDRARGSSVFKAAMDQEIAIKGGNGKLEVSCTKMKDAEAPAARAFRIVQMGLGFRDDADVEILGAALEVDGNPLEFKVGTTTSGQPVTALQVVKAIYPQWPGTPGLCSILGCSERSISRLMKAMGDNGLAVRSKSGKGWEASEKAVNELSMTGALLLKN